MAQSINRTLVELKRCAVRSDRRRERYYQSYLSGIKTIRGQLYAHSFSPINRTLVELKPHKTIHHKSRSGAINRTLVELKPAKGVFAQIEKPTINRTLVELKRCLHLRQRLEDRGYQSYLSGIKT